MEFRAFLEAFIKLVGNQKPTAGTRLRANAIHIDEEGRLNEFFWGRLSNMLPYTEYQPSNTWVGFAWKGRCQVSCEIQKDNGFGGYLVRLEVPNHWANRVQAVVDEFRPK